MAMTRQVSTDYQGMQLNIWQKWPDPYCKTPTKKKEKKRFFNMVFYTSFEKEASYQVKVQTCAL